MRPEVRVWKADLDLWDGEDSWLERWVDDEEFQQSRRFVYLRDARRFLVRRAFRRWVLSRELGVQPESLQWRCGPQGKPELVGTPLQFNASHSAGHALLAVSSAGPVGVDLQHHAPLGRDLMGISQRFSPGEKWALNSFLHPESAGAFFAVWSRKEAVLKAAGTGLNRELHTFDVPVSLKARPQWVFLNPERTRWWLQTLSAGPDFSAALASSHAVEVRYQDWKIN